MIVKETKLAEILVDPMRRGILNLLAEKAMTEAQVADAFGVSDASINHHLKLLKEAGLVKIVRREVESHGILQKFYLSSAKTFFIDFSKVPRAVARYFYAVHLERVRGVFAALYLMAGRRISLNPEVVEQLADMMAEAVAEIGQEYAGGPTELGREELIVTIYGQALMKMLQSRDRRVAPLSGVVLTAKSSKKRLRSALAA